MTHALAGQRIAIAAAGSIGCYVGGCLALAGRDVVFLARPHIAETLRTHGLHVSDLDGHDRTLPAASLVVRDNPEEALARADIILVTVKGGATRSIAADIDRHAPQHAVVVSLQNGVENAERLRAAFSAPRTVLAGMVPFNVVIDDAGGRPITVHRATDGVVLIEDCVAGLADILASEGLAVQMRPDMPAVLWGKLLLNLNNALNALSDLPLAQELGDRRWRKLLAKQMDEALAVMAANGIAPAKLAAAPPSLLPSILRLPDWLFRLIARQMLAIDPQARSSTWEDLVRHRPTEIDEFQGAILRLATNKGIAAPLTARIVDQIRIAEAARSGPPGLKPEALA